LFNDATFPWERIGAPSEESSPPPDFDRNRTPWLAVFVFTQDELKLDPDFLPGGSSNLFAGVDPSVIVKISSTFSVNLPVSEIANLDETMVARATAKPDFSIDPKPTTDLIFLKPELFTGLFLARDTTTGLPTDKWQDGASVYQHRFLAHRRDINTQGMAIAGSTSEEDDTGSFGVIFSNRSGPYNITSPTAVFVHLVSIEGVEKMSPWPPLDPVKFVVLPSLYSWSYICLPPDVPNVRDEFENLGNTLELLRPVFSADDDPKLPPASDPVGKRIRERLNNGYSLSRYRTQTGESTACFTRGPFVPSDVQNLPDWWPATSMAGTDLQILDQELGIMDISYSVAWQVGRTMAIADQSFTTALYRVRQQILNRAISEAHAAAVNSAIPKGFKTRPDLIGSLDRALQDLQRLKLDPADDAADFMRRRWRHEPKEPLDLSYHGPVIAPMIADAITLATQHVTSTPDPEDPTKPSDVPYDEFNVPFSTDWAAVLSWVLDRYFLDGVPAHYLITDASHLPIESLRFFKVDQNWVAALLDGALSFGNHIDQEFDTVRHAIKGIVKKLLTQPNPTLHYPHPVPQYGCFVRSKLISMFPDMIVQVEPTADTTDSPVLLRHDIVDDGTMLCLFSTVPSPFTFTKLKFTQPPHQQTFIVGDKLQPTTLETMYGRAYTLYPPDSEDVTLPLEPGPNDGVVTWHREPTTPPDRAVIYLWDQPHPVTNVPVDLHLMLTDNMAADYFAQLQKYMGSDPSGKPYFSDTLPTSQLVAYQSNNPSWLLPIFGSGSSESDVGPSYASKPVAPNEEGVFPLNANRRTNPQNPPRQSPKPVSASSQAPRHSEHSRLAKLLRPRIRYWHMPSPPQTLSKPHHGHEPSVGRGTFPQYLYNFWPAWEPGTIKNPGTIPMLKNMQPQDIIFSIRLNSLPLQYSLTKIEIQIPIGDPSKHPNTFTTGYSGNDTPSMLSNLRVTPVVGRSQQDESSNMLIIRLIPRSRTVVSGGIVPAVGVGLCQEISFLLPNVVVNVFDTDQMMVAPTIYEYYLGYDVPQSPLTVPLITLSRDKRK
jgi:hypothetical protein